MDNLVYLQWPKDPHILFQTMLLSSKDVPPIVQLDLRPFRGWLP